MTYMADRRPEKIAQLGRRVFGLDSLQMTDSEAAHKTVDALRAFFKEMELPLTLKELGITDPDFKMFTQDFHRDKGNPYQGYYTLTPEDTEAIYRLMQ